MGQHLLLLAAETVEDAEQWLGLVDPETDWELSSFWATARLGELAGGTQAGE